MRKIMIQCLIAAFGVLGCGNDAKQFEPSTDVRCNAAYIMDSTDRVCYFGECRKYDDDLRNHYCPADMPLCIEDEHGQFYCGTYCPGGMYEVFGAPEFASMCKKINDPEFPPENPDPDCSVSDCLAAKGHENWTNAECLEDGTCMVTECYSGYTLYNNNCLPAVQCCGKSCTSCLDTTGWKSGECRDGKCVADSCLDGYALAMQKDGSSLCEEKNIMACAVDSDCPGSQVCDTKTGLCACAKGLSYCDGWCYDLMHDDEHCGDCNTSCMVEHGDGHCNNGTCKLNCLEGYMPSEDGRRCVLDGGECSTVGESHCLFVDHGYEINKCNDNNKWEVVKSCHLDKGWSLGFCSDLDCSVMCDEDYVQDPEQTSCEPRLEPCKEGEYRCNDIMGGREYLFCNNKKWEQKKNCKYRKSWSLECTAEDGCIFECTKGYVLNKEGTECVFDTESTCTNGETRCGGDVEFHRCENNHWTIVEDCELSEHVHGGSVSCDKNTGCHYGCFDGNVLCGKACADLKNDYNHCGSCDNVCTSGKCVNGACQ